MKIKQTIRNLVMGAVLAVPVAFVFASQPTVVSAGCGGVPTLQLLIAIKLVTVIQKILASGVFS